MDTETCKRELVIEIPAEAVRRQTETLADQYRRVARIPGFRRGKAPAVLVRQHFRETIREEILQSLVPKYFDDTVKSQKLSVIGRPRFADLKFEEDMPLTFKATFEILPEFELSKYQGLEVDEVPAEVSEAELQQAIEQLREQAAVFEPVEGRGAENGDVVTVNYEEARNPVGASAVQAAGARKKYSEANILLGDPKTVPDFSKNLEGARAGEKRQFDVHYPVDYPDKGLAGKTLRYTVEVISVKRKAVPPADDELAKSVSDVQTLEELRGKLREDLTEQKKRKSEAEIKRALLDQLIDANPFPLPEVLVEAKLDEKMEKLLGQLLAQGVDPRGLNVDWQQIREDRRSEAEREARAALILEKIAQAENLAVSEEELDDWLRRSASESGETPAAMKTRLTREGRLDTLKSPRRAQKALDFIYQNASIQRKEQASPSPAEG